MSHYIICDITLFLVTQVKTALDQDVCLHSQGERGYNSRKKFNVPNESIFKTLTSLCISLLLLNGGCNISDKNELFCIQSNLQQEDSCKNYTAI